MDIASQLAWHTMREIIDYFGLIRMINAARNSKEPLLKPVTTFYAHVKQLNGWIDTRH